MERATDRCVSEGALYKRQLADEPGDYVELSRDEQASVAKAAPWDLEELNGHVYMEYDNAKPHHIDIHLMLPNRLGVFHNLHCIV